ncbi:hypothetical protein BDZ94DRAFT_1244634, partial [Collybia nuda]
MSLPTIHVLCKKKTPFVAHSKVGNAPTDNAAHFAQKFNACTTMSKGTGPNGTKPHLERDGRSARAREAQAQFRLDCFTAHIKEQETKRLSRLALGAVIQKALPAYEEAKQRLKQAEQNAYEVELSQNEVAFTTKHIVLGSALVTCGPGIDIERIMCGFESCRLTVKNLPPDAKVAEIADLFLQQGIDPKSIHITGVTKVDGGEHLKATIVTNAEQGRMVAIGLDGIPFRDKMLSFEVKNNASANAMTEGSPQNFQVGAPNSGISWWTVAAYVAPAWFSDTATLPVPLLELTNHQFKFFSIISKEQYHAQERQWDSLAENGNGCLL